MLPENDRVRLEHIAEAAGTALQEVARASHAGADLQDTITRSLVRCLEVIGEAASRVSAETRSSFPDVLWSQMIATRNRLIHAYWDVDQEMIRTTVRDDLPPLLAALQTILAAEDGS